MKLTWELTDLDREFFERELESFVPDRIFDVHAHLYELWQWKKPTILQGGPEKLPLERYPMDHSGTGDSRPLFRRRTAS